MFLYRRFNQREANAGPVGYSRPLDMHLREHLENLLQCGGRYTDAQG